MRRDATKSSKIDDFSFVFLLLRQTRIEMCAWETIKATSGPGGVHLVWILGYLFLGKATSHLGTIDWVYLVEATSLVQDGLR